jgi:hypothetical protein
MNIKTKDLNDLLMTASTITNFISDICSLDVPENINFSIKSTNKNYFQLSYSITLDEIDKIGDDVEDIIEGIQSIENTQGISDIKIEYKNFEYWLLTFDVYILINKEE